MPDHEPIAPMLAKLTPEIPDGDGWLYEPKWDGFRCVVTFDGSNPPYLQSRDLKPLGRYFPELVESLRTALPGACVLDGEVVIMGENGLEFESLQLRIHPAESRVRMLAEQTPAAFVAFDMLGEGGDDMKKTPFGERRARLEKFFEQAKPPAYITPCTDSAEIARDWFDRFEGAGFDGVIAKRTSDTYQPGKRVMQKIKHLRTADCVVGGYRWNKGEEGKSVGSLLLGLYSDDGVFQFVGHTSSFSAQEKRDLVGFLEPYVTEQEDEGFGKGRAPGAVSRWSSGKDQSYVKLRPELVCEVTFDYLQGPRFRHASTFKRWRHDKPPEDCKFDQFEAAAPYELMSVFHAKN
ncbi:MAG: ATP-dependent DNA ligase [Dehalococcoidia bacterium]